MKDFDLVKQFIVDNSGGPFLCSEDITTYFTDLIQEIPFNKLLYIS